MPQTHPPVRWNQPSTESTKQMSSPLICIASYPDLPTAGLTKSLLEANGIPCFLDNQFTIGVNWLYSTALGGIRLKVRAEDAEGARQLLQSMELPHEAVPSPAGNPSTPSCPECGSGNIRLIDRTRKFGALSLLLGLPLPVFGKRLQCRRCGHAFK